MCRVESVSCNRATEIGREPNSQTELNFSGDCKCLGHFQVGSYRYRSLIEGLYYRSLLEALCTLNSPPVASCESVKASANASCGKPF